MRFWVPRRPFGQKYTRLLRRIRRNVGFFKWHPWLGITFPILYWDWHRRCLRARRVQHSSRFTMQHLLRFSLLLLSTCGANSECPSSVEPTVDFFSSLLKPLGAETFFAKYWGRRWTAFTAVLTAHCANYALCALRDTFRCAHYPLCSLLTVLTIHCAHCVHTSRRDHYPLCLSLPLLLPAKLPTFVHVCYHSEMMLSAVRCCH